MSIRCTVTGSMTTKFSEMSILQLANAIAVDGMVVESDPFGSGRPSIGFKYRQIDTRPAIYSLPGSGEPRKRHALHTRIRFVLNIRPKNIRCYKNFE